MPLYYICIIFFAIHKLNYIYIVSLIQPIHYYYLHLQKGNRFITAFFKLKNFLTFTQAKLKTKTYLEWVNNLPKMIPPTKK